MQLALATLLWVPLCAGAGPAAANDEIPPANDPSTFAVNVLMNSGFEWIADSTTDPPKYGAYWADAFVHKPDSPADRIAEYAPDRRGLLLEDKRRPVHQIVTLYGPHARRFTLTLRVRFTDLKGLETPGYASEEGSESKARLVVGFMTQVGRPLNVIRYRIGGDEPPGPPDQQPIVVPLAGEPDADGFYRVRLNIGEDMARLTGGPPDPWNKLFLSSNGGSVLVDDVVGVHFLPRIAPRELREFLLEDVRDHLRIFLGRKGQNIEGLELVDPRTGYQTVAEYNVVTGEPVTRTNIVARTGIHEIMLRYLRLNDSDDRLRLLVRDRLKSHIKSMLSNNVYPPTGLYCLFNLTEQKPDLKAAVVPRDFMEYVLEATALPFREFQAWRKTAEEVCIAMADKITELHAHHDMAADQPFARGPRGNWFGRLPEKLTPEGAMDEPKKREGVYDQAWAIKSDRSWYHDFDTVEGLARVWPLAQKDPYVRSIDRCIEKFDRKFDAQRYDLENDTDDHYGMNVASLLRGFEASGYRLTQLRDLAQSFTDYRLPRDAPWDRNLWIEGIRLGSFTTGDQPKAFRGPAWLHNIPAEHNPVTSGYRPYRQQLRELCKGDLKRRILDDGHMTEASSYQWEMISACFQGDYIGPCSEKPAGEWEGDMGDQFAGPSANGFRALCRTLEVCRRGPDKEFIAWYYQVAAHTQQVYRRTYGYRFGLPKETGQRYKIPDRYLEGFSDTNPSGLGTVVVHAETLDLVDLDYEPGTVRLVDVDRVFDAAGAPTQRVRVRLSGPAGRSVSVLAAPRTTFADVDATDWRLRFVDPGGLDTRRTEVTLDEKGVGQAELDGLPVGWVAVDAILRTAGGEDVDDMMSGEYRL